MYTYSYSVYYPHNNRIAKQPSSKLPTNPHNVIYSNVVFDTLSKINYKLNGWKMIIRTLLVNIVYVEIIYPVE